MVTRSESAGDMASPAKDAWHAENGDMPELYQKKGTLQPIASTALKRAKEVNSSEGSISTHYEFLMQAVLLVSATHLAYLHPSEAIYSQASMVHLSKTLSLFRLALSENITAWNVDALIATSLLLVHHGWASIDTLRNPSADAKPLNSSKQAKLDLSLDPLFSLCDGLRDILLHAIIFINTNTTVFAAPAAYRPRNSLLRAVHDNNILNELEIALSQSIGRIRNSPISPSRVLSSEVLLSHCSHHLMGTRREDSQMDTTLPSDDEEDEEALLDASSRLALILAICKSRPKGIPPELVSHITPITEDGRTLPPLADLARYVFSFPTRSSPRFIALVRRNDPGALLILLFFYRAIPLLLPEHQCWWLQDRTEFLEMAIERALKEEEKAMISPILAFFTD
ncbi:hypothetical protein B7463_g9761, partial [Scytalidium lignicola]